MLSASVGWRRMARANFCNRGLGRSLAPSSALRAPSPTRGEGVAVDGRDGAIGSEPPFSPRGRRWSEGPDEGAVSAGPVFGDGSPLDLPLGLALAVFVLVVHQGDALFGEFVADGVGAGEVLGVEGGEAVGDGWSAMCGGLVPSRRRSCQRAYRGRSRGSAECAARQWPARCRRRDWPCCGDEVERHRGAVEVEVVGQFARRLEASGASSSARSAPRAARCQSRSLASASSRRSTEKSIGSR